MGNTEHTEPAIVVTRMYDFTLWLLPKVERFPRSYRFTVGERVTSTGLDLLAALVEAAYSASKEAPLHAAVKNVNVLRYLLRLAKDLNLMKVDSYAFASEHLDEIGRMTGGWQRLGEIQ